MPSETYEVFKNASADPVEHYYDKGHRAYDQEAKEFFEDFLKKNNIDPSKMTSEEAKQCLNEFKNSDNPKIKDYLDFLKREGGLIRTPAIACPICFILDHAPPDPSQPDS